MYRAVLCSVFVFLALVAGRVRSSAKVYPASSLSINNGEGFVFHLVLPSDFQLSACRLVHNGTESIELSSGSGSQVTSNLEIIEPVQDCGARVKNVSTKSPGSWQLQADPSDSTVAMEFGILQLDVLSSVSETHIFNETGIAGHFGQIKCPGDYNQQRYCEIIDPWNKVIENCETTVKYPALNSDPIVYSCKVLFWGRVDSALSEIHVRSHQSPSKVVSQIEDSSSHVVLSCQVDESLSLCRAESLTTGNQYLIMDGFQSRRYSTWNTLLEDGLCQFEIPKPLANNETGVWRIHGKLKRNGVWTGCLLDLNANMTREIEAFNASLESVQFIERDSETIDIRCPDSPYPLDYCYLETPEREVIRPSLENMKLFKTYGRCYFNGIKSTNGRYTCGFNAPDHSGDLFKRLDLKYNDPTVLGEVQAEIVHFSPKNRLSLLCYALMGHTISSCVFVSPSGDSYHLLNDSYANQRFGYYGRGFVEGECGIELYEVDSSHAGNWTCSINLVDKSRDVNLLILVKSNGISVGTSIGIAIGVLILLIGCVGGFIIHRRRRITADNESENEGERIPM